ncbi:MAG: pyruvate dehydrogenase E1 component [Planctomycetota bacterium]|nr:MAG: pyruvate dehydrogenase E1 component [Planctomycetota bacterium]
MSALDSIARRAMIQTAAMIHIANHRKDAHRTDPKVGGHPASCSSSAHILAALHCEVRKPADFLCCKPHAAPIDHVLQGMLGIFREHETGRWFEAEEIESTLHRLRDFSENGEPVLQSYHARTDPDSYHFLPSGSVGIPPVVSGYMALAYRYARDHSLELPEVPEDVHFWSLIGDSEFREGSLMEAMPDFAERELGNVTWIIDYNRQNLDGARMPNKRGLAGTDAHRIEEMAEANGWEVIQVRHGSRRREVFKKPGGKPLQEVLESGFSDYELQMHLLLRDMADTRKALIARNKGCKKLVESLSDADLEVVLCDVGGHDTQALVDALLASKKDAKRPTMIVAHTVKGWGLDMYAAPGNHSEMPKEDEVGLLLEEEGLDWERPFANFAADTEEGKLLAAKGAELRDGITEQLDWRVRNRQWVRDRITDAGGVPTSLDIDAKLFPRAHTQWMWGQLAAKLVRIGTNAEMRRDDDSEPEELGEKEKQWEASADFLLTMSPDVGTSTQLNPVMNERVYGARDDEEKSVADIEERTGHTRRRPQLQPSQEPWTRHIRFEIAEANCMSAVGAFGVMGHYAGIPFFPIMTVYDFFIKRALDQLYYNLYWGGEFVIMGTPSGVTLSSEGAQHSWKSDIQIPNLITWEPIFAVELDWILCESIRRHFEDENDGRKGILIRAVTRGIEQGELVRRLRRHPRFRSNPTDLESEPLADETILEAARHDCLSGAYYMVDFRGQPDYEPGVNVVNVFAMGSVATEALEASDTLREQGIYANVISVSSPDLLLGILASHDDYAHLRSGLGLDADLHLNPREGLDNGAELVTLAGRRVPVVSVHDGEAGLLDNIGSILGVRQESLAVRKFSKCGRPDQVYRYQGIDAASVIQACGKVLSETALESVKVSRTAVDDATLRRVEDLSWQELWDGPGGTAR